MSRQNQDYEERSGPVRDEVAAAATHNETHPKLKRQLEKRRSIAEPERETNLVSRAEKTVRRSGNSCAMRDENPARAQLKRHLDAKRSATQFADRPVKRIRLSRTESSKSKFYRRRTSHRKDERPRRSPLHRVAKRRDKRPCTCSKCLKKPVCRKNLSNFCVYVVNRRIGTDTVPSGHGVAVTPKAISDHGSRHSVDINTPSGRQSVSSYNSYDTSDHQPLV